MSKTLSCLVLLLAMSLPVMAADYDLVMDPETMLNARLNVGVKD